jgi:hypothetical protein
LARAKASLFCDIVDAVHLNHAVDLGAVEAARIVDAAAER